MSIYKIETIICDDQGLNCSAPLLLSSTEIPVSDGWFGLDPSQPEYWDVIGAFVGVLALVWMFRAVLRFLTGRK